MPWAGIGARFELSVRELTPIHEISEDSRPYSILGQRFMTTLRPAASALAAAKSSRARRHSQGFIDHRHDVARIPEDLDHVDGTPDIQQRADEGFCEQALADVTGVDGDHVVAALRQILEGEITRPHIDRRRPDHRDRLHAVEDLPDVIVGVGVMVHCVRPFGGRHCEERSDEQSRLPHSVMVR